MSRFLTLPEKNGFKEEPNQSTQKLLCFESPSHPQTFIIVGFKEVVESQGNKDMIQTTECVLFIDLPVLFSWGSCFDGKNQMIPYFVLKWG